MQSPSPKTQYLNRIPPIRTNSPNNLYESEEEHFDSYNAYQTVAPQSLQLQSVLPPYPQAGLASHPGSVLPPHPHNLLLPNPHIPFPPHLEHSFDPHSEPGFPSFPPPSFLPSSFLEHNLLSYPQFDPLVYSQPGLLPYLQSGLPRHLQQSTLQIPTEGVMVTNRVPNTPMSAMTQEGQEPPKKKTRIQVKKTCVNCQNSCKKYDDARPCERCIKYRLTDTCVDSVRKERKKGVKRGPYKPRKNVNRQSNLGQGRS